MKKSKVKSRKFKALLFAAFLSTFNSQLSTAWAQQAQAQQGQPLYAVNAKYVQGVGPGYWPTAGAGLTLNIAAGTAICGNPPVKVDYAGGTLTMTNAATNYVYLDPVASCVPAKNTTGFTAGLIPLAQVVAAGGVITGVTDVRTWFVDPNSLGPVIRADLMPGADAGAQIFAAIAALPTTGGTVDALGLEAQTFGTLTISKSNVTVLFGVSTFTASTFPAISITVPGVRLIGLGAGQSVIKVADGAGLYKRIVYATFTGSGLEIAGLTFDHNVANNPRSAKPDNVNDPQVTIGVYGDAKHIRIYDNEVKNTSSVNNIDPHALNIEDVWITNNRFTNIGNDAGLKGTHTGANNAAVLTDAAANWTVNGLIGLTISNLTDISSVVITANTANTVTGVLTGGTDNDWDAGDVYSIQFDSSVIYTHGIKVLIEGNIFEATTAMDPGAVTAIETHGSDTTVRGNVVRNFVSGANITGIFQTDTRNVIVADNIFDNCMRGINLWSQTYSTHVTGFGLDGVSVKGNKIALGGKTVFVNGAPEVGIGFGATPPATVELDSRGISITDNIITHPFEGVAVTSYGSYALGWSSTDNMTLYDSEVSRNTVVNFPKAAIRLECVLSNVKVENNILRNNGSSLEAGVYEYQRAPISILAYAVSGLTIDHNSIVDDIANTRFYYPIWLYAESGTPTGVYIRDNTFLVTGAKNAAFRWVKPYQIAGPIDIKPLFVGQVPDITYITSLNTELFAPGSQVLDMNTGSLYRPANNGYTWAIVSGLKVVTFSTTPTFDASLGNTQKITLTANVTSSTLSNATAGQTINFLICQDGTGSRTFVWPTNVKGAMTIGSTLSTCSAQDFIFDGTNAYAVSSGVTNM